MALFIHQLISVTPDPILNDWRLYLLDKNYQKPLELLDILRDSELKSPSKNLCTQVYSDSTDDTYKRFKQLCNQLLKHYDFVSLNYPYVLQGKFEEIQSLVKQNRHEDAIELSKNIFECAEKLEDFQTCVQSLKFCIQCHALKENKKKVHQLQEQLLTYSSTEHTWQSLRHYIRLHFDFKNKQTLSFDESAFKEHLTHFEQFKDARDKKTQLLCWYGIVQLHSYYNHSDFYSQEVHQYIKLIEQYRKNYPYLIMPYEDDILINMDYFKLKYQLKKGDGSLILKTSMDILKKWEYAVFWKNHVNLPQSVSLSVQVSHYATKYCFMYRRDYQSLVPTDVFNKINELRHLCASLLENHSQQTDYLVRFMNMSNFLSMLDLLTGQADLTKKGLERLEQLLTIHQQVSFQKLHDSLFTTLTLGYYTLRDYDVMADGFKRYEKLTRNQSKIPENDITIRGFYYMGQYLNTGRDQYLKKFDGILRECQSNESLQKTGQLLQELRDYELD